MPTALDTRLAGVVGAKTATSLEKAFGIETVADLLNHFPRRYAKRGELTAIADVPLNENVTIVAEVLDVRTRPMRARKGSILEVRITDGRSSRALTLTFFNQAWREKDLRPGVRGIFAGKVGAYRGSLQLSHPDYELFDSQEQQESDAAKWASTPIPLYPATAKLASWQIARALQLVMPLIDEIPDPVPADVRAARNLIPLAEALHKVHAPQVDADWQSARESLRFTEAFVLQTALLQQRAALRERVAEPRPRKPDGLVDRLDAMLPFTLTDDQRRVGDEIATDLESAVPMSRLVQGEVGSGKTLVALRAMLQVAEGGGQSVLLAPTEVLASQHFRSIVATLGPDLSAELMPTLLTGQMPVAQKRSALLRAVAGQARIIVGTHALLSDKTAFFDLGLIVVDEQHRFGVEQRAALQVKAAKTPHSLVLTATPIPRTVAMTVFGDLDVSTIEKVPEGRPGIVSHAVPLDEHPAWINRVWERVGEEIALGRQAFVVCPAIDATEVEDDPDALVEDEPEPATDEQPEVAPPPRASVATVTDLLRAHPLLGKTRIESLHGRMSADDKDRVMRAFAAAEIDILVSTTVIEVGVDVPNASTMVVMDADRFGVSQLHQLRGRVGRGAVPGLALFVTHAPEGTVARARVDAVAATTDGFELSRVDLELRSEGDVLGSTQSGGRSSLRLLRAARDGDLIADARSAAEAVLSSDPTLDGHTALRDALRRRLSASEREYLNKG